ncbi:MAG: hypothetical protein ACYC2H_01795 [Thermoplasmatota archaeon]
MALRRASLGIVLLLLAGCSDKPTAATVDDGTAPDTGGPLVTLDAATSVAAPSWQVGQWWEWEVFFADRVSDETFCSIVLTTDAASYTLVTEKDWAAKDEATFDRPLLGTAAKGDLTTAGWGGDLDLLDFPLSDGKTWTARMPNIAWDVLRPADTAEIAMAARFDADLEGYRITGTAGGGTIVEATYLPATGWFGELVFHDIDPGQEGVEVGFRAKSTGLNYTGPYFLDTATPLVSIQDRNGFDDDPSQGGQPITTAPQPYWTFTMTEGTLLYGFIEVESVAGARSLVLVDPANQQRNVVSHGDLQGGDSALFLDEPGQAGEWRLATAGAGGFTGTFARLFEVTEGSYTM